LRKVIYLAGAIGCYGNGAEYPKKWRSEAISICETLSDAFSFLDPTRFYEYGGTKHKSEREVMKFDLRNVKESDVVLVNLKDIEQDLYMLAWEKGLKGVTIYRDGCKRSGILSSTDTSIKESKKECNEPKFPRGMIIKADNNCIGKKRTLHTGCGTLHCVALFDPVTGDLLETYLSKGSAGGCLNTLTGLSRLMSLSARGGVDIYSIVDQLKSCGTCPSYAVRRATKHDTSAGSSCPVAVGNALLDMYKEMQNDIGADDETVETENYSIKEETSVHNKLVPEDSKIPQAKCPECGGILVFEGGCQSCKICGYTKCE